MARESVCWGFDIIINGFNCNGDAKLILPSSVYTFFLVTAQEANWEKFVFQLQNTD